MATPQVVGVSFGNTVASDPYKCGNCGRIAAAGETALLRCSRCKLTWYCNRECQNEDWKEHKMRCTIATRLKRTPTSIRPPDMGVELGPSMNLGDLMKSSPQNIDKQVTKRDPTDFALTKDQDAICNILIERIWLASDDANKNTTIGPMLYRKAYRAVKNIWCDHTSTFNDGFNKTLALVGGFDAIESINVPGGNRFCGKTTVIRIRVEKNAGVANELRMSKATICKKVRSKS